MTPGSASRHPSLTGRRILLVEDEYVIARDMAEALERQGAEVVGPAASLEAAMVLLSTHREISGAILDVKLHGGPAYAVAEVLRGRGVPFLFATGYDRSEIPPAYQDVPHCEKPVDVRTILSALALEIERCQNSTAQ